MEISEFTFRILLLFLPGIICSYVVDALTEHRPWTPPFFLIRAIVFGFTSYLAYWDILQGLEWFVRVALATSWIPDGVYLWICKMAGHLPDRVHLIESLDNGSIDPAEVVWVCLVATGLGLLITVEATHKAANRLCRKFNITRKFGELDVWGFTMNSPDLADAWVIVRDCEKGLAYEGQIRAFSDNGKDAELLLSNVNVYDNKDTGALLYESEAVYISRSRSQITLEFKSPAEHPTKSNHEHPPKAPRK